MGLVGKTYVPGESTLLDEADSIRQAMLAEMGFDAEEKHPSLWRRITYIDDLELLWYMRADWVAAVALAHGEGYARSAALRVSRMFEGYLPRSLTHSRPAPQ